MVTLKKEWVLAVSNEKLKASSLTSGGDLEEASAATFSVIFDMDGTLINNTPYHYKSWQILLKKYGKGELTREKYYTEISGVPVLDTIRKFFGADHDEAGLRALLAEKEAIYQKEYAPYVAPVNGLENFLAELKSHNVKIAMASSATLNDIDFIFDHIPIRQYFDAIIDSSKASKSKPDPQIFLNAADALKADYQHCIVFEDSLAGIKAGNAAGMKVVGITTGHTADELHPVNLVINNFTDVNVQKLADLFDEKQL